ncbi:MAG: cupin domain-containing protein [Gemmataceae bacterium]
MSSCELPLPGQPISASPRVSAKGSRLHRFRAARSPGEPHLWDGVPVQDYKPVADHHCGVLRSVLIGEAGERTRFHVRYFEIAPGGYSTLEHHRHEHVVIVLRGGGEVRLGETWHAVGFGDTVYVAPDEVHRLRNRGEEPFGFLCMVDAERDRPVAVSQARP